ncbi:S8 family serine peptidase [uncultured Megamonas sp.]|uniref:S8 family serine peptidase n=2 Tax=uncultured Megamonas sp. TaxID=286140 RepID=UPI0025F52786|nr:S8 family serine peptidase [uncultured Megamonas sp.]
MKLQKEKNLLTKIILLSISIGSFMNFNTLEAKDIDDFRTNEYKAMGENVLDVINAARAYAQGYTGKGVILGICDWPINFNNPEFKEKNNSGMLNEANNGIYNWQELSHGTAVAGVVAANKNNQGMHGVAFDANIQGVANADEYKGSYFSTRKNLWDEFLNKQDIKVINNSWGTEIYLSYINDKDDYEEILNNYINLTPYNQMKKAIGKDKLLVFSADNSGHTMPGLDNVLSIWDNSLSNNIINVTASDASFFQKENDIFKVTSGALAIFSDLAQYVEDKTLTAPGVFINTTYSDGGYINENGTSFSAPMVTGVGGLVQEAFPYLGGKQIGDVLLSTANNKIINTDGFFITFQVDNLYNKYSFNIFYTNDEYGKKAKEKSLKDLAEVYYEHNTKMINYYLSIRNKDEFLDLIMEYDKEGLVKKFVNMPMEALFGQGMVDAGKAVKGLGAINVRRLTSEDISDDYTVAGKKEKQALYKVDTQGYNSIWSNDIKEIRAGYIAENPLGENNKDFNGKDNDVKDLHDRYIYYKENWIDRPLYDKYVVKRYIEDFNNNIQNSGLLGLHAGLIKDGEGILNLTGNNTYQGSSIVKDGTLQIDGSIKGDAYSIDKGILTGKGLIEGNVYNNSKISAGSYGNIDTLKINGNLSGDGEILVNTDGEKFNVISVGNTADISNMNVTAGQKAAPNITNKFVDANNLILSTGLNQEQEFSGLLNAKIELNGNEGILTTIANNNTKVYDETFKAINSMYNNLNSNQQFKMYDLYALDTNQATTALEEITGGFHMNMAHDIIKNRDVVTAVEKQTNLDRDNSLWILNTKHWQNIDDINSQGYSLIVGKDFKNNDKNYNGILFSYSENSLGDNLNSGEYDNYSLGLYAGTKNRANTLTGYLSYGVQNNNVTRNIPMLDKVAKSDYDSNVLGLGMKYAYDLDYGKEHQWHIAPYGKIDMAHYKQNDFQESNADLYNQKINDYSDNYLAGEVGIELNRKEESGNYGIKLGYKKLVSGANQDMKVTFVQDKTNTGYTINGVEESKDHLVLAGYIDKQLSDKWSVAGQIEQDWSSNSNELSTSINFNYQF